MNKIEKIFQKNKNVNIAYIVGAYPSIEYTEEFLENLDKTSIDILEIGVPYSDPLADGKIISEASFKASQSGITLDSIFNLLGRIKDKVNTPLVFLIYYNLIYSYGIDEFIKKSKENNISGIIIPDLPYEEAHNFAYELNKNDIAFIPLVSVTSQDRIPKLVKQGSGFIYAVASLGITGTKQVPLDRLNSFIKNIKEHTSLPVSIGFGVKNHDDVKRLRNIADGVIMGTTIVKLTEEYAPDKIINEINNLFQ